MKIAGIVAEYNPFHKGHAYQIQKIRELLGKDAGVVCVMSGDFVQRGEPAMFSKYARAEAAVRCGADLVLELPVHCSVASAERFAQGAVHILGRLGVVDYLVFGSESGDCTAIEAAAQTLLSAEFDERLRSALESGCSYPTARAAALQSLSGENIAALPNDNLGTEYIKAIRKFGYEMQPIAIKRVGAMHDSVSDGAIKSGSEIRAIASAAGSFGDFVPEQAYAVYEREIAEGRGPVFLEQLEPAILSRLRMLPDAAFADLADAAEGLEHKLFKACRVHTSLHDIYDAVKSKRYTHARIRRMAMCAALEISKWDYEAENLYARVLALNERGGKILRMTDLLRRIEIISKPATIREQSEPIYDLFRKTAAAHDLYVLSYPNVQQRSGEADWRTSPLFVR